MPAVSMKSTGPRGRSSIGFSTGSVVVPAKSRDDRDVLPCDGVEQAALADVAAPEDADVQAHAAWCVHQAHASGLRRVWCAAASSVLHRAAERLRVAEAAHGLGREQLVVLRGREQAVGDDHVADRRARSGGPGDDGAGRLVADLGHERRGGRAARRRTCAAQRSSSASMPSTQLRRSISQARAR